MVGSFFKSARNKIRSKFQGKEDAQGISSVPGSPARSVSAAFAADGRHAFTEANINLAAFKSAEEFNRAAAITHKEMEAASDPHKPAEVSPVADTTPSGTHSVMGAGKKGLSLDTIETALDKGCFNVAVVGNAGSGKSSLMNALSGLHDTDLGAAAVAIKAVQADGMLPGPASVQRLVNFYYPESGFIFYEISSKVETEAGEMLISKLKLFDCILVVSDDKFGDVDALVGRACGKDLKKPCLFVRNKADVAAKSLAERQSVSVKQASEELRQRVNAEFQATLMKAGDVAEDDGSSSGLPSSPSPPLFIVSSRFHTKAGRTYHLADDTKQRIDKSLEGMDEPLLQTKIKEVYDFYLRRKVAIRHIRASTLPKSSGAGADAASPTSRQFSTLSRRDSDSGMRDTKNLSTIPEASSSVKDKATQAKSKEASFVPLNSYITTVKAGSEVRMPINKFVKSISISVSQDVATIQIFH